MPSIQTVIDRVPWKKLVFASLLLLFGHAEAQDRLFGGASDKSAMQNARLNGSVTFFYRSNELTREDGFSSFGPAFEFDGSLGERVFYSANFAFSRRERLAASLEDEDESSRSQFFGGARIGFRVGEKSLFEVEYRNGSLADLGSGSLVFLDGAQQSRLSGVPRNSGFMLALRNKTQLSSAMVLNSSVQFLDHSSSQELSSTAQGPLPDVLPSYIRRLEVQEQVSMKARALGKHSLETGLRFVLDQIGMQASTGDTDGELYESKEFRASNVGLFFKDLWVPGPGWRVQMGVAYELPGIREVNRRGEWTVGVSHKFFGRSLELGSRAFLRNGVPRWLTYQSPGALEHLAFASTSGPSSLLGQAGQSQTFDDRGLQVFVDKNWGEELEIFFSYTFSSLQSSDPGEDVAFGTVEADAPSVAVFLEQPEPLEPSWKRTHLLNFKTSYRFDSRFEIGSSLNYFYGTPLQFVTAEVTKTTEGADYARARGSLTVDLHLEKVVRIGRTEVGLMVDVFNLLDSGSLVAYDARYNLDLAALTGRRVQLGMRYGF